MASTCRSGTGHRETGPTLCCRDLYRPVVWNGTSSGCATRRLSDCGWLPRSGHARRGPQPCRWGPRTYTLGQLFRRQMPQIARRAQFRVQPAPWPSERVQDVGSYFCVHGVSTDETSCRRRSPHASPGVGHDRTDRRCSSVPRNADLTSAGVFHLGKATLSGLRLSKPIHPSIDLETCRDLGLPPKLWFPTSMCVR